MNLRDAIGRLGEVDARLRTVVESPASLAPDRSQATPLATLAGELLVGADERLIEAFTSGLSEIVDAQIEHFPETLFWDIDFLAASILRLDDAETIASTCDEIAQIQSQYGRSSVIRFRYVHDFTYGFDWAKWVLRAPDDRAHVGPFDPTFIAYLRRRGEELTDLIAHDDETYPKLADGRPRNPFGFSREPCDERTIGNEMAGRGLIPVETWKLNATPVWDRPFAQLREELAKSLGITLKIDAGTA